MWRKEKKKACPFFLLENSRPLSPWGPLGSLSTCLGNDSLRITPLHRFQDIIFFSFEHSWLQTSCAIAEAMGPTSSSREMHIMVGNRPYFRSCFWSKICSVQLLHHFSLTFTSVSVISRSSCHFPCRHTAGIASPKCDVVSHSL